MASLAPLRGLKRILRWEGRKEGRTLSMTAVPGLLPASERLPCSVLSVGARPEPSGRASF